MADKIWFLRRLNLFEGMSEAELEEVSHELRMRSCPVRTTLSDGAGDRVYLIKQGKVRLYQMSPEGHDVTTAVLVPGQLFGFGAFLTADGSATQAEVIEESLICEAGTQDFLAMLAHHPILMAKVVMVMARQIFHLEQTIESMASQPVAQRLANLLVSELEEGEPVAGGVLLPWRSQEELAKLIGTTRETVARTFTEWRSGHLIGGEGRRIIVLDQDRLRREAGTSVR